MAYKELLSQREHSIPKWTPEGDPPFSMMLIGKTGEGKSATANTILGWNGFKNSSFFCSETSKSRCKEGVAGGRNVLVVDTPGVFDTKETDGKDSEEDVQLNIIKYPRDSPISKEVIKGFYLLATKGKEFSGIDAFILVLRSGKRFTEEDLNSYKILKQIFGESLVKHTIVLFTNFDSVAKEIEGHSNNYADWLKSNQHHLPNGLRSLLEDCHWRVIAFNNNLEFQQSEQACDLIKLIDEMAIKNDNKPYNSEFLENAKKLVEDKIDKKVKEIEKKKKELEEKENLESQLKKVKLESEKTQKELKEAKAKADQEKAEAIKQATSETREEISEGKSLCVIL